MMSANPEALSAAYARDGYCVVENLLSDSELQALRERTAGIVAGRVDYPAACIELEPGAPSGDAPPKARKLNRCAEHDPVFREHAGNAKVLAIIQALIGADIKLFDSQAFLKPPGGIEKPYHQDSAYFSIEPMAMVTCWTALDDVTIENGCMWVIPGSHRKGLVDHSVRWMVGEREDKRVPDDVVEGCVEQAITLSAGSCSFHHSLLLHSSRPNRTPYGRRGLAVHYMSARSRWCERDAEKPHFALLQGREYPGCV